MMCDIQLLSFALARMISEGDNVRCSICGSDRGVILLDENTLSYVHVACKRKVEE